MEKTQEKSPEKSLEKNTIECITANIKEKNRGRYKEKHFKNKNK